MKKMFTVLIPLLLLYGCVHFPVVVDRDPFKGISLIKADMWHTVIDSDIDNRRVLYQKEIAEGAVSDPTVSFVFVADIYSYDNAYYGEDLKPEAYILAGDKNYKVALFNQRNKKGRSGSVAYGFGYSWFVPYYRGVVISPSRERRILTAKLKLTPEIQEAIARARTYMIRFYVGDNTLTLQATPEQLDAVKKFLAAGPEKK